MTNTETTDVDATLAQIRRMQQRVSISSGLVPSQDAAAAFANPRAGRRAPGIDIHFDYWIALSVLKTGGLLAD